MNEIADNQIPKLQGKDSSFRLLLVILFLGLGLRLTGWTIIDTIYRDSVGYINCAATWTTNDFLRNPAQEPLHILAIRTVHSILFPHQTATDPIPHAAGEQSAFVADVLFSLASIWILFGIGKKLHSTSAGLWAAFFLAIQPFGIIYTINGLTEAPYTFFLLSTLYFTLLARREHPFEFFLAGLWAFLGILVRKDGVTIPAVVISYILIMKDARLTGKTKMILSFLAGFAFSAGTYLLIGGRFYWIGQFSAGVKWIDCFRKFIDVSSGDPALLLGTIWQPGRIQSIYLLVAGWIKLCGIFPAILFLAYLIRPGKFSTTGQGRLFILTVLFQMALVFAFTDKVGYFSTRYLYAASVVVFPIAGMVMVRLIEYLCRKYNLTSAGIPSGVAAGILLIALTGSTALSCYHMRHPEIRESAKWIAANLPKDSVLCVTDNRVGFYCERKYVFISPWFYKDVLSQTINSPMRVRSYLAIYGDLKEKKDLDARLVDAETRLKFKAVPLKTISVKKKEVAVYKIE